MIPKPDGVLLLLLLLLVIKPVGTPGRRRVELCGTGEGGC